MGPTALLPFRRKACCGFFGPEKSNGFGRVLLRGQHQAGTVMKRKMAIHIQLDYAKCLCIAVGLKYVAFVKYFNIMNRYMSYV
jgi:hypothetical protein